MSGKNKTVLIIVTLLTIPILVSAYLIIGRAANENRAKVAKSKLSSISPTSSKKPKSPVSSSSLAASKTSKRRAIENIASPKESREEKKASPALKPTEQPVNKNKPEPVNYNKRKTSKDSLKLCPAELQVDKGSGAKTYPLQMNCSGTVLDLLKTASSKYGFSLKYKNYSYGVFINEIDGLHDDETSSMYWLYYINGKLANLGASKQKVKKGDVVLWKYEKADGGL